MCIPARDNTKRPEEPLKSDVFISHLRIKDVKQQHNDFSSICYGKVFRAVVALLEKPCLRGEAWWAVNVVMEWVQEG